jgi:hypothetical protein
MFKTQFAIILKQRTGKEMAEVAKYLNQLNLHKHCITYVKIFLSSSFVGNMLSLRSCLAINATRQFYKTLKRMIVGEVDEEGKNNCLKHIRELILEVGNFTKCLVLIDDNRQYNLSEQMKRLREMIKDRGLEKNDGILKERL